MLLTHNGAYTLTCMRYSGSARRATSTAKDKRASHNSRSDLGICGSPARAMGIRSCSANNRAAFPGSVSGTVQTGHVTGAVAGVGAWNSAQLQTTHPNGAGSCTKCPHAHRRASLVVMGAPPGCRRSTRTSADRPRRRGRGTYPGVASTARSARQ